jgi:ribokinase
MKYDIIAIGDMVTDTFIHLLPQSAEVIDDGKAKLCFGFGDKIPFAEAIVIPGVGNSANAAVAAARLGLATALVGNVGNDHDGGEMIARLEREGVRTEYVYKNNNKISNYHYVLWYKDDRTILIRHEAYEYHLPAFEDPGWIYFSSVGESAARFHDDVAEYVRQHPNVKLVFQPGTFQIKYGADHLVNLYKQTELFFCNREEAQTILMSKGKEIPDLIKGIRALGPKIVVITDGVKGAYALDGDTIWFMKNYPDPKPPYERTGAGDAFSSTFTAAIALGLPITEALMWAPVNSMSVVQYVGAQEGLLRRSQLEGYLAQAPADYRPQVFAKL